MAGSHLHVLHSAACRCSRASARTHMCGCSHALTRRDAPPPPPPCPARTAAQYMRQYLDCLEEHDSDAGMCMQLSKQYLRCRMQRWGLSGACLGKARVVACVPCRGARAGAGGGSRSPATTARSTHPGCGTD